MKIVQLNTWHGRYLRAMVDFLIREQPDIILLQELTTGPLTTATEPGLAGTDVFTYLKGRLGFHGVAAPVWKYRSIDGAGYQANGLLSRYPLEAREAWRFYDRPLTTINRRPDQSWFSDAQPENFVAAILTLPDKRRLRIISTHLHWTEHCTEAPRRMAQARTLLQYLEKASDLPTVIAGDFNIHPASATLAILKTYFTNPGEGVVAYTVNRDIHPAWRDWPHGLVVDYILTHGLTTTSIAAPDVLVSDHLPVVAEASLD